MNNEVGVPRSLHDSAEGEEYKRNGSESLSEREREAEYLEHTLAPPLFASPPLSPVGRSGQDTERKKEWAGGHDAYITTLIGSDSILTPMSCHSLTS